MWSSGCGLNQTVDVVWRESDGCDPVGVFWRESEGAVTVGVIWRESEGAVQWVCSGGNQRVLSSGRVLEGIRG